mmetsp:Transcript_11604/g.35981  ORF Transcript_11604/g.35981 Transcript_11604/m.35981 type:complete len:221 (+) Transcript_11604:872-1534(+)
MVSEPLGEPPAVLTWAINSVICDLASASSCSSTSRCAATSSSSRRACSSFLRLSSSRVAAASSRSSAICFRNSRCSTCSCCIRSISSLTSASPEPRASTASERTDSCKPSRRAMEMAFERPGMPQRSRYVGAIRTSSNSTHAFSKTRSLYFRVFSDEWCVVHMVRAAVEESFRKMAAPKADPSVGSVPAPTSSRRTRESGVARSRMDLMRAMWAEKVESD